MSKKLIVALALFVMAAIVVAVAVNLKSSNKQPNSFEECKKAGGAIAESYPEQCLINGKGFTNPAQSAPTVE